MREGVNYAGSWKRKPGKERFEMTWGMKEREKNYVRWRGIMIVRECIESETLKDVVQEGRENRFVDGQR